MRAIFRRASVGHEFIVYDDQGRQIGYGWTAGSRRDAEREAKHWKPAQTVDAVCAELPPEFDTGGES